MPISVTKPTHYPPYRRFRMAVHGAMLVVMKAHTNNQLVCLLCLALIAALSANHLSANGLWLTAALLTAALLLIAIRPLALQVIDGPRQFFPLDSKNACEIDPPATHRTQPKALSRNALGPDEVEFALRHPARIMIVTSNPVTELQCRRTLANLGFNDPVIASNGNEAIKTAPSGDFDLILIDCQLPGIEGCVATKKLRAAQGRWLRASIVGMADLSQTSGEMSRCQEAGISVCLDKPINARAIKDAILSSLPQQEASFAE